MTISKLIAPDNEALHIVASVLRSGGIVAFPGDTSYGLAVDVQNPEALDKLIALKGRHAAQPFPVLVSDMTMLEEYGKLDELAEELVTSFMPGPLTLVLPREMKGLPDNLNPKQDEIGLRIPEDAFMRRLIETLGDPITGTSANRSGSPPLRTPQEVIDVLGNELELVIDSGETSYDKPSTVVNFMVSPPAIIRKGAIPSEKIMEILDGA